MKTLMLLLVLGSHGTDAYWTNHNMVAHGVEHDPFARPFVHGTAWCYTSMGAEAGFVLLGAHVLRKHNHNNAANLLELSDAAGHTYGAARSYQRRKEK